MRKPVLSIITVNLNNNLGLQKTLRSIQSQSYTDYEHIIIDANSTDGSLETIIKYTTETSHLSYWISEPDKGIYDGMNKGIAHNIDVYINKLRFPNFASSLGKTIEARILALIVTNITVGIQFSLCNTYLK